MNFRVNWIAKALKVVGVLFGAWGVFNLLAIPFVLIFLSMNASNYSAQEWTHHLVELGILGINAVAGISILYAFTTNKRWGLYVALAYNALLVAVLLFGAVAGRIAESNTSMDFYLIYALLPSAVIALCLRSDVKELLSN